MEKLLRDQRIKMHASNQVKQVGEYIGQVDEHDIKNGLGRVVLNSEKDCRGEIQEGEWLNNMMHGYSRIIFHNGDTYVGEFQNYKPHGTGTYSKTDGVELVGKFSEGQFVYEHV